MTCKLTFHLGQDIVGLNLQAGHTDCIENTLILSLHGEAINNFQTRVRAGVQEHKFGVNHVTMRIGSLTHIQRCSVSPQIRAQPYTVFHHDRNVFLSIKKVLLVLRFYCYISILFLPLREWQCVDLVLTELFIMCLSFRCGNVAAILELDEHLQRDFTIFEAAPQVSPVLGSVVW